VIVFAVFSAVKHAIHRLFQARSVRLYQRQNLIGHIGKSTHKTFFQRFLKECTPNVPKKPQVRCSALPAEAFMIAHAGGLAVAIQGRFCGERR